MDGFVLRITVTDDYLHRTAVFPAEPVTEITQRILFRK
ncbi:hypothetical protein [Morganella morganii IS15]|nr:hypothetical protein CSB69_0943 [Morganella morganii]EMP50876.1 hypothetical protein C790_01900 [Morganella morganii SC01]CDK67010.1 hypothetical protein [Morganella morganii IS15]